MAVFAGQFAVHVLKFKFGVFVVVELNLEPPGLGVTGVTLLTVISAVSVVHLMTKITIRWGVGIALIGMAVGANHVFVAFF